MNNMFSVKDKVAIIVGGTRGIGEGIAQGLAEAGAKIVIVSRNQTECDDTAKKIQDSYQCETMGIAADVKNINTINSMVDKVAKRFGRIDVLVNSAGINVRKDSIDYTEDDWDLVQNVQLKGVFFTIRAVGKYMIDNNIRGKIITISSIDSMVVSRSNIISYMAAKGGATQLTKSLAVEWADFGICVNAIAPGYFETVMTKPLFENKETREELFRNIPQKRFGDPYKDLAGLAIYLASDASNYTTGQTIFVDGGYTLI